MAVKLFRTFRARSESDSGRSKGETGVLDINGDDGMGGSEWVSKTKAGEAPPLWADQMGERAPRPVSFCSDDSGVILGCYGAKPNFETQVLVVVGGFFGGGGNGGGNGELAPNELKAWKQVKKKVLGDARRRFLALVMNEGEFASYL